jgi:hypothetical protein
MALPPPSTSADLCWSSIASAAACTCCAKDAANKRELPLPAAGGGRSTDAGRRRLEGDLSTSEPSPSAEGLLPSISKNLVPRFLEKSLSGVLLLELLAPDLN